MDSGFTDTSHDSVVLQTSSEIFGKACNTNTFCTLPLVWNLALKTAIVTRVAAAVPNSFPQHLRTSVQFSVLH
jgi:hypothetical protein